MQASFGSMVRFGPTEDERCLSNEKYWVLQVRTLVSLVGAGVQTMARR